MRLLFLPAVFIIVCTIQSSSFAQRTNVTEILDNMFHRYDHRVRPQFAGAPVEVNVTMYILGISSVSEKRMEFTMDLYFRQFWTDERLRFQQRAGFDRIALDSSSGVKIWEPDTFFSGEKTAFVHNVPNPNFFIRIHSDGKVSKSSRISITAACPMNLKYFPMDSQLCSLELESYVYKATDIVYNWGDIKNSVGISPEVVLPQFKVIGHRTRGILISLSSGTYSRLALDIQLTRSCGYYVMNVFMPAAMIVIISWTAFLLKNALIRMLIGLSTTLTLTLLLSSTNASLPNVSYVKAIDIYTGICMLMVFAALVVHTVVEHLASSQNALNDNLLTGRSDKNALDLAVNTDLEGHSRPPKLGKFYDIPPSKIDKVSILGFPIFFIVFNCLYCIIYSIISGITVENLIPVNT